MFTYPYINHKLSPLTYVHGAGATDALPAGPPEGQAGVHLVLDLDQGVQDHRAAVVQINLVIFHLGFASRLLRVKSVDGECLLLLGAEAPGALLLCLGGGGRGRGPPQGEVEGRAGSKGEQLGGCVHCHGLVLKMWDLDSRLVLRSVKNMTEASVGCMS